MNGGRTARIVLVSSVLAAFLPAAAAAQRSGHFVVNVLSQTEPKERHLDRDYRLTVRRFEDMHGEPFWEVALRRASDTAYDNLLYHSTEWHGPYPVHVGAITISQHLFPATRVLRGYRGAPYVVTVRLRDDIRIAGADTNAVFRGGSFDVSWRPKRKPASANQPRAEPMPERSLGEQYPQGHREQERRAAP